MGITKEMRIKAWLDSLPKNRTFSSSEALDDWFRHVKNAHMDKMSATRFINRDGRFVQLNQSRTAGYDNHWIHRDAVRGNEEALRRLAKWTNPCAKCKTKPNCPVSCAPRKRYDLVCEVTA